MGEHDGHRERLKNRLADKIRLGRADSATDMEILEMLLFSAIPRRDVMPLAQALLDRFGSLGKLMEQTPDELCSVSGVGGNAACLIAIINEIADRAEKRYRANAFISGPDDVYRCLVPRLCGLQETPTYQICLDGRGRVLTFSLVKDFFTDPDDVFGQVSTQAMSVDSKQVILARGTFDPCPVLLPGEYNIISSLNNELNGVKITLLDHVVFSEKAFCSFSRKAYIKLSNELRGLYRPSNLLTFTENLYTTHSIFENDDDK